jgi:hypothetical protein
VNITRSWDELRVSHNTKHKGKRFWNVEGIDDKVTS